MGIIGKISSIKKVYDTAKYGKSLASSLAEANLTMFPGTGKGLVPFKENDGSYRTGLDENALYIKYMSKEEGDQERTRVREWRENLEGLTGLELGPKSSFYKDMFSPNEYGSTVSAGRIKLEDGDNIFNLDDAKSAIAYYWLRVHPDIAPSLRDFQTGKVSHRCKFINDCKFYVNDETIEADVKFEQKSKINRAISLKELMSPTRRLKVASLLGINISYNSKDETIYNKLDDFIKDTANSATSNIANFFKIAEMSDESIDIRFKVKQALEYNIYRLKNKKFFEGDIKVADSEEELIDFLTNPKNQDDYLALVKKIDTAKSIETT